MTTSTHPYQVVIPSHARAGLLTERSLATTRQLGIPDTAVTVIVDTPELPAYRSQLNETGFGNVRLLPGGPSLRANRQAATAAFPENTPLLCMDDDIERFMLNGPVGLEAATSDTWVTEAFARMTEARIRLTGLSPVANAFYMTGPPFKTGWLFVYGCAFLTFNTYGLTPTVPDPKDDYERTCQHLDRFGAVGRLPHVAAIQKFRRTPGGLQARGRTEELELEACAQLLAAYPQYLKPHPKKPLEIQFRRMPKAS